MAWEDERCCIFGLGRSLGNDDGKELAGEPDDITGKHRPLYPFGDVARDAWQLTQREVAGGEDSDDARHFGRR